MTGLPQVLCPMLMRLAFGLTVNKEANRHLNIYLFLLFELFLNGKTHQDVNTQITTALRNESHGFQKVKLVRFVFTGCFIPVRKSFILKRKLG